MSREEVHRLLERTADAICEIDRECCSVDNGVELGVVNVSRVEEWRGGLGTPCV